jgi:hypothetical protein
MFRTAHRWLGLVPMLVGVTTVALAVGHQPSLSSNLIGEPWPPADPLRSPSPLPGILALDANAQDELSLTLADQRIFVSPQGQTRSEAHRQPIRSDGARIGFHGEHRWIIIPPRATLVDGTGQAVRTIGVPPRTTASLALANGDLAFLTPNGSTLVSIVNQQGVMTAAFGEPITDALVTPAQKEWLNRGSLLETASGEIVVVFRHQPYPMLRRYQRTGTLLGEHILRSPGLDRHAAASIQQQSDVPSMCAGCAGGLISVFGATYDRVTDTVWVATASDDAVGSVRIVDNRGDVVAQVQLKADERSTPTPPSLMAFGGRYLYWTLGRRLWRVEASEIRRAIRDNMLAGLR